MEALSQPSMNQIKLAYRPKTQKSYNSQFRTFIAFCNCMQISIFDVQVQHMLCFMEFLSENKVSVNMIANYLSAVKAKFIVYGLNCAVLQDQKINLYLESLNIHMLFNPIKCNIMSIQVLQHLAILCQKNFMGLVYKSVHLAAYFGLFRLSYMAPHSIAFFDACRHLTAQDITFTSQFIKINL